MPKNNLAMFCLSFGMLLGAQAAEQEAPAAQLKTPVVLPVSKGLPSSGGAIEKDPAVNVENANRGGANPMLRQEEMVQRMRMAVEKIAEEYGNPVFVQLFGNDAERLEHVRERLRNLDRREELQREVSLLEERKTTAEAATARMEARLKLAQEGLARLHAALDGLEAATSAGKSR